MRLLNTKRTAFTWDQDYKGAVSDIKDFLKTKKYGTPGNPEIFMLCLAVGFESGMKRDVPPRKSDSMRMESLKPDQLAVMRSIALHESKDSEILTRDDAVFDVVEQYAAAGLMLLAKEVQNGSTFRTKLVKDIYKTIRDAALATTNPKARESQ